MFPVFSLSLSQFEITQYEVVRRQCTTQVLGLAEKCGVLNFIFFFFFEYLYDIFLCFHQPNMLFDFWRNMLFLNLSSPFWLHSDFSIREGLGLVPAFASCFSKLGAQGQARLNTYCESALQGDLTLGSI